VPHCHAPFDQFFEAYNAALERWVDNFRDAHIETVNFGYLILRRSAHARALEYSTRTIHNPTRSMSEHVRRHFREQAALQSSCLDDTVTCWMILGSNR
jgi:carbamoyltransferase